MAGRRIALQPEEAAELQRRLRAGTVSVRDRRRSEIILLSAEGLTQQQIAKRMGVSRLQVNRWVGRFAADRLAGLRDAPGRSQAVADGSGDQAGIGAGGDTAAASRALELPHDGARRRHLGGERAAVVGRQRHQTAPVAHLQTVERPLV